MRTSEVKYTDPSVPRRDPYFDFAKKITDSHILTDPWIDGDPRFSDEPVILGAGTYALMQKAAEHIGALYDELVRIILREPHWLDDYFHLTPHQKMLWFASGGRWHGMARLDMFLCTDGRLQVCEMNSDTPSGEAEAVLINQIIRSHFPRFADPNAGLETQFIRMVLRLWGKRTWPRLSPTVGIVYPTEMPEDLSMIRLYQRWLESRGAHIILGSPYNLGSTAQRLTLLQKPVDVLIRHYKTDWWCERLPVWKDQEPFPDALPLVKPLQHLMRAWLAGQITMINPPGAVLTQNKLTMAFFWEHLRKFSPTARNTIRTWIPETRRLITKESKKLNKNEWVLKSDYGCEGDEVIIGNDVSETLWKESLSKAIPKHWILQRYFSSIRIGRENLIPNFGLYLVGGRAAGIYTRLSDTATDGAALSAATLIDQHSH